jgi:hypothetical protein
VLRFLQIFYAVLFTPAAYVLDNAPLNAPSLAAQVSDCSFKFIVHFIFPFIKKELHIPTSGKRRRWQQTLLAAP